LDVIAVLGACVAWVLVYKGPVWTMIIGLILSILGITGICFAVGPELSPFAAIGFVLVGGGAPLVMRGRASLVLWFIIAIAYACVVAFQAGNTAPATRWISVVTSLTICGMAMFWLTGHVRALARAEHTARAEVAELNATLEDRVEGQVREIDELSRLERFLSPQVAQAVRSSNDFSLLTPHRCQISVFFSDLRGFTRFSTEAEPEDVVDVLDAYYAAVGSFIRTYGATVGHFAGDGIMAYFNDPVPCEDPAGTAVSMALELRPHLRELVSRWERRGYDLSWGMGIGYGYATVGMIGFEGRNDYTPLGSVVNLAARLCGEAGSQEILIDRRTRGAITPSIETDPRDFVLKGFSEPVTAYALV
jgi:class 3 adenylate cyclase